MMAMVPLLHKIRDYREYNQCYGKIKLPPDPNQVGADEEHEAGGDKAAGRNGEKHQESHFCLNQVIAPDNKVRVV